MTAVEHRLTRYHPDTVATWQRLFHGKFLQPAVAAAFVRGTLGGLVLFGMETVLGHVPKLIGFDSVVGLPELSRKSLAFGIFGDFFLGVPDPALALHAIQSGVPVLFVLGAALVTALLVGLVALGAGASVSPGHLRAPATRREWLISASLLLVFFAGPVGILSAALIVWRRKVNYAFMPVAAAFVAGIVCPGINLPLAPTLSIFVGQFMVPLIAAFVTVVLLLNFDVLTAVCATATFVVLAQSVTLTDVLSELGNSAEWLLLGIWALLALGAAVYVFRAQLSAGLQKAKAASA
jgi:hypothetical protein